MIVMSALFLVAVFSFQIGGKSAFAKDSNIGIEVIPAFDQVLPDEKFSLIVHLTIPSGWHIYWKEPGYYGLPTELDLFMDDKPLLGDVRWAIPVIKEHAGEGITSQYDSSFSVAFLDLPMPSEIRDNVELTLKWKWLECSEELCIPKRGVKSVKLPMTRLREGEENPLFAKYRKAIPEPVVCKYEVAESGVGKDRRVHYLIDVVQLRTISEGESLVAFIGRDLKFEGIDRSAGDVLQLMFSPRGAHNGASELNRRLEGFLVSEENTSIAFVGTPK
jgi:hypothetical protein